MQNDEVIHCHCFPKSECTTVQSIGSSCATNEGCFKSIHINSNTRRRDLTMGCFKNKSQHYLMHCNAKPLTKFEIKCCRTRNYCNLNLTLPSDNLLNTTEHPEKPHIFNDSSDSSIRLIFAIVVPICLLVIMAVIITIFWKSIWQHKQKSRLKLLHHSKNFHETAMSKTPLFVCPSDSNLNSQRTNIGWQIDPLLVSGLPGSKNSSGIGVKSNCTATTFLSESDHGVTLDKLRDDTCTSGSGSGLPFLVQRTVARQITLVECIGKGKFGEVWKGQFQGELVAVKIFSSREESSWTRETTIYNTVLLRHDNILGYYASDLISQSGCTQLWMVMQYHPLGSLNDYLTHNFLDIKSALKLAHSAAAGLCHLHTSIFGLQGKPVIAHRDIKSKNILVKSNGTCCIADLGLALFPHTSTSNEILCKYDNRIVGTKRYMAPELLEIACSMSSPDINTNVFNTNPTEFNGYDYINAHEDNYMESLKAIDVYAFSLVLWEIASCVVIDGVISTYQVPFGEMVVPDPSFDDMYRIVVEKNQRPLISNSMKKHLNPVAKIIEECWHRRPSIRLTMLRVKKSLFMLMKHIVSLATDSLPVDFPAHESGPEVPDLMSQSSHSHSNMGTFNPHTSDVQL